MPASGNAVGKSSVVAGGGFTGTHNTRGSFNAFVGGTTFASGDGNDAYAVLPFTKGVPGLTSSGPLPSWLYTNYSYAAQSASCPQGALSKPHAVTAVGQDTYCYDQNGNMVRRIENGATYTQNFDVENRLTSVQVGSNTTTFVYDGAGALVKKIQPDGTTTVYVGGIYEAETSSATTTKKSYYPNGALRVEVVGTSNTLYYLLKDHLGSASVTLDMNGTSIANGEQRFYPFGESRITNADLKTDQLFTGQRYLGDGLGGLYHYNARVYLPSLNRMIQADTIVPAPGSPQSLNRYAYVANGPINYVDPTGHIYDTWANCNNLVGADVQMPDGSLTSQADCWQYNQELNLLLNAGVTFDVLRDVNQDTAGLSQALTNAFGIKFSTQISGYVHKPGISSWDDLRSITISIAKPVFQGYRNLSDFIGVGV